MHVGLNLVFLTPGEQGGMETYARELIAALARRDDVRLTTFVNTVAGSERGPWNELAEQVVVPVDARRRVEWVRGEQQYTPRLSAREGVDVLHSLGSTAPWWGRVPRVTTIHDLLYAKVPEAHFGLRGLGMRVLVPGAARRSTRVIVDAASTRDDLVSDLGLAAARIDVVPLAAGGGERAEATPAPDLRAALDLGGRPVVLSVSAKRPHKNLMRLLRALATFDRSERPLVVIPGYPTPHEAELWDQARALEVDADLRMPGWLPAADLEGLYALAELCVLPSLYEGFGLPVLEAMRRGVPVACSDRSSLPEVAGDAAVLFDPEDERAIASAMRRLLADPELRATLREAGPVRAARFSWDATAEGTMASYALALNG